MQHDHGRMSLQGFMMPRVSEDIEIPRIRRYPRHVVVLVFELKNTSAKWRSPAISLAETSRWNLSLEPQFRLARTFLSALGTRVHM